MVAGQPVRSSRRRGKGRASCGLCGAEAVNAGLGRKGGARLFDDGGLDELRFARGGERLANFFQAEVDDFFAGFLSRS